MNVLSSKQFPQIGRRILTLGIAAVAVAALVFGVLGGTQARAQNSEQVAQLLKPYTDHAKTVVQRLTELNTLPAEEWRYHAGDLAHGESPELDDSSWQLVKPRMEAPHDAVWFRRWMEVPQNLHGYDLTGARIWFEFRADANGPMPEIIYFNGRRVALGDDLEPIVLFDKAKPGEKVLVAVKLLHTVDNKNIRRDGAEDRLYRKPAQSRRSAAGSVLGCTADSALFQGRSNGHGDAGKGHRRGRSAALEAKDQAKFDASLKARAINAGRLEADYAAGPRRT